MAKKIGIFTSILLGVAGGAAAAAFLATESGKKVKKQVNHLYHLQKNIIMEVKKDDYTRKNHHQK